MGKSISFHLSILKERECLGDLGVDGRLMFQRVNKHVRRVRCGFVWVSVGIIGGCCVYGDELVDWMCDFRFLEEEPKGRLLRIFRYSVLGGILGRLIRWRLNFYVIFV